MNFTQNHSLYTDFVLSLESRCMPSHLACVQADRELRPIRVTGTDNVIKFSGEKKIAFKWQRQTHKAICNTEHGFTTENRKMEE
jgi:hypothetical protein